MTRRSALALVALLVACQHRPLPAPAAVPQEWPYHLDARAVTAAHGMVVSDQALASHVGVQVLAGGGNAVDAAVATAFALAVVLAEAGNLGGGGFAVVRGADDQSAALDFRETAPVAATRDMYLDASGRPTADSLEGPRSTGVPGTVAGLAALHAEYGTRPWAELLAPAIALADDGFPVDQRLRDGVRANQERLARWPASDQGETAALVAAEMARDGGLITQADLAGYAAKWRAPIDVAYRGNHIVAMPLPSAGGTMVAEIARILEGYDLRALGWHSAAHLTVLAEAEQRAFADRNAYLGDPDFVPARAELLGDAYIARRRATIDVEHATPSSGVRPGLQEGVNTTHMAVVDGQGGAVALTTTLNELYGSAITVAGAGFLLNDEMDDFAAKPGTANLFGLVQGAANRIAPGKRPLSSLAPTIVVGPDGRVRAVAGARGGSRIISATFQVLSNVLDFDMDAAAAVSAPRIHHQHLPDVLAYETNGLDPATQRALEERGFKLAPMRVIANAPAIVRVPAGWSGFADPRRGGGAEGY